MIYIDIPVKNLTNNILQIELSENIQNIKGNLSSNIIYIFTEVIFY